MVRAAIRAGLDAMVLTDHDRPAPPARLARLNAKFAPFRVFGGIEVSIVEGEHVSVLGLQDARLGSMDWSYPDLHAYVRERGGYLMLNHPFRYVPHLRIDVERYPPDGIEAYSNNTPVEDEERILALAAHVRIQVLSNSDAHHVDRIGAYWNELSAEPSDDAELLAALRHGVVVGPRG